MKSFRVYFEDDVNDADVIDALSSIKGKYRVHDNNAHWIDKNITFPDGDGRSCLMCSCCHVLNFSMVHDDYCRHCGAFMDASDCPGISNCDEANCVECEVTSTISEKETVKEKPICAKNAQAENIRKIELLEE